MIESFFEEIVTQFDGEMRANFWKNFENFYENKEELSLPEMCEWVDQQMRIGFGTIERSFLVAEEKILLMEKELAKEKNSTVLAGTLLEKFRIVLSNLLGFDTDIFQQTLFLFFYGHFAKFSKEKQGGDEEEEKEERYDLEPLLSLCRLLENMGLLKSAHHILSQVCFCHLEAEIANLCSRQFEESHLDMILAWSEQVCVEWVCNVLSCKFGEFNSKDFWRRKFTHHVHKQLCQLRVSELFDIIVDFPDSLPAVEDLRVCLLHTSGFLSLASNLREAFRKRLLQPGATTQDILRIYICSIKVLLHLDPSGMTLREASRPARKYLSNRKDTIRCIVQSLTDATSELFHELKKSEGEKEKEEWFPEPIDINTPVVGAKRRQVNVLSMLIHIYGGKERFLKEYKEMLKDRLCEITDFEVTGEVEALELLSLRFGEDCLQECSVMVRDMIDSKKLNHNLHSLILQQKRHTDNNPPESFPLTATVFSHCYWPISSPQSIVKPVGPLKQLVEEYEKSFVMQKKRRKLEWDNRYGFADLELEISGKTVSLTRVPSLEASILLLFTENDTWKGTALAEQLGITQELLRKKINFWLGRKIISAQYQQGGESTIYSTCEDFEDESEKIGEVVEEYAEEEEVDGSELWNSYQNFVFSMLKNQGPMNVTKIFTTMSIFVPDFGLSSTQVKGYLDKMVQGDLIHFKEGVYFLN